MTHRQANGCSEAVLVEALHDGRLGERERASVERHLARCAACRSHRDHLEGLSRDLAVIDPVAPFAHARARADLLRGAAQTAAPPRRGLRPWTLSIALLLAAGAAWGITGRDALEAPVPTPPSAAMAAPAHEVTPPAIASSQAPAIASAISTPSAEAPVSDAPRAPAAPSSATARPSVSAGARADGGERVFARAVEHVGTGEFDVATEQLERFSKEHPDDPRVDEADYLVAIALERAGKVDEAALAARRYLAKHPEGAHRAEAETIARRGSAH